MASMETDPRASPAFPDQIMEEVRASQSDQAHKQAFDAVKQAFSSDLHDSPPSSSNMPFWTQQDTKNAILSTLIPGGAAVAAFAVFVKDQETVKWWADVKKPEWAPKDVRIYSALDLLALSPLGYASYLVYKNGGGFDYNDTKLALALYGANVVLGVATIPIVKQKKLGCLYKNTILLHLTAVAAAVAFYKIDKPAGLWMAPYAVWTGFYSLLTYSIYKENKPIKDL